MFVQVDELMRQELANWKLAVDKEKSGKAKGAAKVQLIMIPIGINSAVSNLYRIFIRIDQRIRHSSSNASAYKLIGLQHC